jgi:hypothetical protein
MANRMKMKHYNALKNETFTMVKFTSEGRRVVTVSGMSVVHVLQELMSDRALIILLINEADLPEGRLATTSRDIKDYEEYFKMEKRVWQEAVQ